MLNASGDTRSWKGQLEKRELETFNLESWKSVLIEKNEGGKFNPNTALKYFQLRSVLSNLDGNFSNFTFFRTTLSNHIYPLTGLEDQCSMKMDGPQVNQGQAHTKFKPKTSVVTNSKCKKAEVNSYSHFTRARKSNLRELPRLKTLRVTYFGKFST